MIIRFYSNINIIILFTKLNESWKLITEALFPKYQNIQQRVLLQNIVIKYFKKKGYNPYT